MSRVPLPFITDADWLCAYSAYLNNALDRDKDAQGRYEEALRLIERLYQIEKNYDRPHISPPE